MPSTHISPPFEAYKGADPYIFISYAHRDSAAVFPELVRLQALGCNIWYDEGIDPGNEWPDEIANALRGAAYFVFFVSPRSVASVNCRNEVYFALEQKKPFLSIYIEETNVTDINAGLGLSIGSLQAIMKYQMDETSYERKLKKTVGKLTVGNPPAAQPAALLKGAKKSGSVIIQRVLVGVAVVLLLMLIINPIKDKNVRKNSPVVQTAPAIVDQPTTAPIVQTTAQTSPTQASQVPGPKDGEPWKNSLGMNFVPAGTPGILFCTYLTRVEDFQAFVTSAGYQPTTYCYSYGDDLTFKIRGDTWQNPGFPQGPDYPVVGISWDDANAFCNWLSKKEHQSSLLAPNQSYRLPSDTEWTVAAGTTTTYPWGESWPPPENAGNYQREGDGFSGSSIHNKDGYKFTSPVGSFPPNKYGLYDMSGNAFQWCQDWYKKEMNSPDILQKYPIMGMDGGGMTSRVLRGGSWVNSDEVILRSSFHSGYFPSAGGTGSGFRCVLVVSH
jgi:hypothetical protein